VIVDESKVETGTVGGNPLLVRLFGRKGIKNRYRKEGGVWLTGGYQSNGFCSVSHLFTGKKVGGEEGEKKQLNEKLP